MTSPVAPSRAPGSIPSPRLPAPTWTLIYDGDCAFCRRCVALLSGWDRRRSLERVPFQDDAALARLPAIPRSALERAMHLVSPEGGILAGAAAAPALLRLLPGGLLLALGWRLPGVAWLADRLYRLTARNRHRLGCGSATCTRGR